MSGMVIPPEVPILYTRLFWLSWIFCFSIELIIVLWRSVKNVLEFWWWLHWIYRLLLIELPFLLFNLTYLRTWEIFSFAGMIYNFCLQRLNVPFQQVFHWIDFNNLLHSHNFHPYCQPSLLLPLLMCKFPNVFSSMSLSSKQSNALGKWPN